MKHNNLPILSMEFKGPIYEEECYCPNPSINNWLSDLECLKNYKQIHNDLISFTNVNFDKIRKSIIKAYDRPGSVSLCHYVVQSNKGMLWTICRLQNIYGFYSFIYYS